MNVQKYHNKMKSEKLLFNCAESTPNRYKCVICNFQCYLKIGLFNHSVQVHNLPEIRNDITNVMKKWNCENCNFQTFSILVFYKHHCKPWVLNIEIKENSETDSFENDPIFNLFKCKNCDFFTNVRQSLICHVNQVHSQYISCKKCTFPPFSVLPVNKQVCTLVKSIGNKNPPKRLFVKSVKCAHVTRQLYPCEHCECTFALKQNLRKHVIKEHIPKTVKWFNCEQCYYKTKRKPFLKRHLRLKHTLQIVKPKLEPCFKCEQCDSSFAQKLQLQRHIELQHTMSKTKWYECNYCDYVTKNSAQMGNHISQHPDNLKTELQQCEHCDYKTELKSSMTRHLELIHAIKSNLQWFDCAYCEETFVLRKQTLKHLEEKHSTSEEIAKPFRCRQCSYTAQYLHIVQKHMVRYHSYHEALKEHNYSKSIKKTYT